VSSTPNPYAPPGVPADEPPPGAASEETQRLQARIAGAVLCVALGVAITNVIRGHTLPPPSAELVGMLLGGWAFGSTAISFLRGRRRFRFFGIALLAIAVVAALMRLRHNWGVSSLAVLMRGTLILGAVVTLVTGAPSRPRLVIGSLLGGGYVISLWLSSRIGPFS
jgi:hypothetical protein